MNDNCIIRKAIKVYGNSLVFRNVDVTDAPFILALRTDAEKSRYLSSVKNELDEQRLWLEKYSTDITQAYFIIEYKDQAIGTVRLYDSQLDSFCWGSWILAKNRPMHAAMESALMVYAYAIDHLYFSRSHFDVRKGNERVWQFHERFGARRIGETKLDYLYTIERNAIDKSRNRFARFLSGGVEVDFL